MLLSRCEVRGPAWVRWAEVTRRLCEVCRRCRVTHLTHLTHSLPPTTLRMCPPRHKGAYTAHIVKISLEGNEPTNAGIKCSASIQC